MKVSTQTNFESSVDPWGHNNLSCDYLCPSQLLQRIFPQVLYFSTKTTTFKMVIHVKTTRVRATDK